LGSSAAAIIGGMVLARAMVTASSDADSVMSDAQLLALATTMESHPDNLAASLHGGFTVAWLDDSGVPGCVRLNPHTDLRAIVAVPSETLATSAARQALPDSVTYADAVHNLSRSALLVHAITRQPDLLWEAMSDRLHQVARADVYPESVALVESLRGQSVPAAISGAGPSVLVITHRPEDVDRVREATNGSGNWVVHDLPISDVGAQERPIDLV
jgi:homoserine kinase